MYHAKLHPEQYSDTFSTAELKQLHASIVHVCQTAVDALGDSSKFPDEWLFNHRWGKGKKDAPTSLPNGAKITFLKVGGRTSCVVPSVQKKTGAVAGDLKTEENGEPEVKTNGKTSRKRKTAENDSADEVEAKAPKKVNGKVRGKKSEVVAKVEPMEEEAPKVRGKKGKAESTKTAETAEVESATTAGRRRSSRGTQK